MKSSKPLSKELQIVAKKSSEKMNAALDNFNRKSYMKAASINTKAEQKLPYDIIEFVRKKCVSRASGKNVDTIPFITPEWNGNSDDVKQIRKMMREVYGK